MFRYTYADRGSFVAGRGFPFGFWPIYAFPFGIGYYGSREVRQQLPTLRKYDSR